MVRPIKYKIYVSPATVQKQHVFNEAFIGESYLMIFAIITVLNLVIFNMFNEFIV